MCGFPIFSFPFRQILLIEFRQKRFAIDIDIGIDSEIFIPVDISKLDDTGIIQQVGKTLFFKVSRFALFRVSAFQLRRVDATKADGNIFFPAIALCSSMSQAKVSPSMTRKRRETLTSG